MGKPKTILILRHAEKPQDPNNEKLSVKGYERAAALAYYLPDAFGDINHIFAAGVGKHSHSHRPVETITPLANRLDKKIHDSYLKKEYKEMVNHVFSKEKYTNETIAVCWEHKDIKAIADEFGATNTPSSTWSETCFDLVWKLTLQNDGSYLLDQIAQLLLYGDSKDYI